MGSGFSRLRAPQCRRSRSRNCRTTAKAAFAERGLAGGEHRATSTEFLETFTRNASEQRPEVFTIPEFYFPDDSNAIATEGIEHGLVRMDDRDMRATIGGTGICHNIKGQNREYRIWVNGTGLFNLSFTFTH
jgi:hypothetical protein